MGFKRGQGVVSSLLYLLFELAIVAMFMAAVLVKVNGAVKDQTYYQRYLARDTALTVDALHSAEGNFTLFYTYSTPKPSELDFLLLPGEVRIYRADERNFSNESRHFSSFLFGKSEYVLVGSVLLNATTENSAIQEENGIYGRRLAFRKEEGFLTIDDTNPKDIRLP